MADFPDLSHLTSEERSIIEGVIMRQRQEEERQNEIMRRKQDEVQVLEETIRARSEKHKKAGIELDTTCHICLKTKFADGVGHICNYCNIRCCARCGGKVSLRSNKSIWVCIVCRKKQELLSKSGQWMKSNLNSADNAMLRRMQEDMQGIVVSPVLAEQSLDKRPKLERAHSAAEKENLPLQRSSSVLRRQYSQQEQVPGRRMSASECVVEKSVAPHSRTLPTPHVGSYQTQTTPRHPNAYPDDDPSLYKGELDDLMKQNQMYQMQQRQQLYQEKSDVLSYPHHSEAPHRVQAYPQQHSVHQTQGASQACATPTNAPSALPPQKSFSSSEEERTTPECDSDEPDEKGKKLWDKKSGDQMNRRAMSNERIKMFFAGYSQHGDGQITRHNGHGVAETMTVDYNGHCPPRELRKDTSSLVKRSFRRSAEEWRADSRRFTERRGKKTVRFHGGTNVDSQEDWSWEVDRQGSSQDSATKDSGIETSSNFTSSEDSNRGDLPKHPNAPWQVSSDGLRMTGQMILRKSGSSGGNILGLKVVGGKLLEDGTMGALIEKVKKGSSADVDGHLKAGDEVLEWNGIPLQGKSFQEVADIIAQSKQEPQVELVVTRNLYLSTTHGGPTSMTTTTTPIASRRLASQTQWKQKNESIPTTPLQLHHKESYDTRREKPSVLVTSPGATDLHPARTRHHRHSIGNANVGGRLQLKTSFDPAALQLVVTLICATGLTPNSNGQPRNPYAKLYLLPDRSEKSKRRTKTLANTNDPRWDQTFVYNGIRCTELRHRALEITVWDYGKYGVNNFLGEVVLALGSSSLNNELEWHYLMAHEEHRQIGSYEGGDETIVISADCHLSPPSTTSRLSDSDTSECDITDYDGSREHRRTADGASISSIGSSSSHYSSPPPEKELCMDGEHRSRRDMLSQGRKRAAFMVRDHPSSISAYHHYFKEDHHRAMLGHRSLSAAPMDSPSLHYRGRSQSPTGHRSLSPPDHRSIPYSHGYVTRFTSKSATATPTGSPKKRQLPQIPHLHAVLKDRVASDFEERSRFIRYRNRPVHMTYRNTDTGGWEKHYSGLSDSDLPSISRDHHSLLSHAHRLHRSQRGRISSKKDIFNDFGDSDMESVASVTSSAFSTQSERPRASRGLIDYASQSSSYEKPSRHELPGNGHAKRGQFSRSFSNTDAPTDEKADGSLSDTAVGLHADDRSGRGRRSSPGSKSGSGSSSGGVSAVQYQSGMGKKSNSTSQLSATGRKRRLGFGKKGKSSFTVHRSEEVLPEDTASGRSGRQPSSASSDGEGSIDGDSWSPSLRVAGESGNLSEFIEGLGPGQLVGRQVVATPSVGDIQLTLRFNKGQLEIEVVRATKLQRKKGTNTTPAPFVKVYLVNGKKCIAKAKTSPARKTLEPLFQQNLTFRENFKGCILQVTVWGDYGRLEGRKVFMGVAQIMLDKLNLNEMVFGWYKLYGTASL